MTLPLPGLVGGAFVLPPQLSLDHLTRPSQSKGVALSRKGAPWSDEEHKAFLAGLKVYGRGQWKQISRLYVPSRTPTQVASHAQKHFLRQSGAQKRRSRFSAVEEAVAAAPLPHALAAVAPVGVAPLSLPHAPGAPPLGVGGGGVTPAAGVPGLLGHPAVSPFLPPPRQPLASAGAVVGGIAMGVPIGVLPPLPSITTASGTELPILPVMPGRINALAASPAPPPPPPAAAASSYSADSSGSGSRGGSPAPLAAAALPTLPELPLHSHGSAASGPSSRAAASAYTPSGRAQQLIRLLELNEQLASGGGGTPPCDRASSGSTPTQPPQQQSSVRRVPSATAALDTLALLAEAEAEAQSHCESHGGGGAAAAAPPAAQQRGAPLVSAC